MPEISTLELYNYRAHRTLQELHGYRRLLVRIREDGRVKEPVELITDGRDVVVREGHRRIHAAIELGIRKLPVKIISHQFGINRRMKYPIGPELAAILAAERKEPDADISRGAEDAGQAQDTSVTVPD